MLLRSTFIKCLSTALNLVFPGGILVIHPPDDFSMSQMTVRHRTLIKAAALPAVRKTGSN